MVGVIGHFQHAFQKAIGILGSRSRCSIGRKFLIGSFSDDWLWSPCGCFSFTKLALVPWIGTNFYLTSCDLWMSPMCYCLDLGLWWPWTVMTLAWDGFFPHDHLHQPLSCLTLVPRLCWEALLTLSLCHLSQSSLAPRSQHFSCSGILVLPSLYLSSPTVGVLYYSLPEWSYPCGEADVVSEVHSYVLGLNVGSFQT